MSKSLLLLLCAANLAVGTGAFIITSVLPQLAAALQVSVPAAGQAMTAYALSTAFLAPLALLATGKWSRRRALAGGMALFTLGNLVCLLADNLGLLMAGRVLMGAGAVVTPVAAGVVVALAAPAQRGKALSLVFLGMSMSYVLGLPLGSWLVGLGGWRLPIAVVCALCLLMTLLLWWLLPRHIATPGAQFKGLGALLVRRDVLAVLGVTLLALSAVFTVFSYVVPVLQALTPMAAGQQALTLMLFGLSGMAGTLIGGWATDRFGARRTLLLQLLMLATMMALLPLTGGHWPLMMVVLVLWGVAGFGLMAAQQSRLAALSPPQAPLLLSLNSSMLYLGTALGAALGGIAAPLLGFDSLGWASAPLALAALALMFTAPAHQVLVARREDRCEGRP